MPVHARNCLFFTRITPHPMNRVRRRRSGKKRRDPPYVSIPPSLRVFRLIGRSVGLPVCLVWTQTQWHDCVVLRALVIVFSSLQYCGPYCCRSLSGDFQYYTFAKSTFHERLTTRAAQLNLCACLLRMHRIASKIRMRMLDTPMCIFRWNWKI